MPVLQNSRHEKFALIVSGSAKNADANVDNWLNAPGVREHIAEFQEQTAEECGMERIGYAKSLVAMYQSPPSAAFNGQPALRRRPYQVRSAPGVPLEDLGWK